MWIGIRYPNATYERYEQQLKKADRVLSNAAAKLVIEEASVIHGLTEHVMTRYRAFSRQNKKASKFELTQREIDEARVIQQRFGADPP